MRAPAAVGISLAVVGVVLASCGNSAGRSAPLPAGPQVVEVTMREYRFDYRPPAEAGRALFRVRNAGSEPHSLSVFPLSEDIPPIDQQLRGTERRAILPFAGIPALEPGERATFAVDLAPGVRYALVCFVPNADGKPHALDGMNSEFRAPGPPPEPPPEPPPQPPALAPATSAPPP